MGYDGVELDPAAFDKDLHWDQLSAFLPRLRAQAEAKGLGLGVKFSNTLVCRHEEPPFADGEMYLSGPPLHVLATKLAARFRAEFPTVPITFSAGVEAANFPACVQSGLAAITSCSDLLKGGGYGRMTKYLRALEKDMAVAGAADLASYVDGDGSRYLATRAASLEQEPAWHRDAQKAPRKVGTDLVLLDCLTCDKCIPVCPNAANFAFDVPKGTWTPGRVAWRGGSISTSEGRPLIAAKRHQIGNVADACNLCGQCDPWCPEDGGPYLAKPTLFLSQESWDDHPEREGFLVAPDRSWIRWRRPGVSLRYVRRGAEACLETDEGQVWLLDDAPVRSAGTGDLDLRDAVTLRLLLEGFEAAGSRIWLNPV
jgi:putative selenate reductase